MSRLRYKHIQAAHEARMWIKEVIIPTVSVGLVLYANPQVREAGKELVQKVKTSVQKKFKKKGEENN